MAQVTKEEMREVVIECQKNLEKQVTEIHGAYFGNGKPGIKTKVAILETRVLLISGGLLLVVGAIIALAGKLLANHFGGH